MLRIITALRRFLREESGAWFIALLVGLALNIIAYLLMPKPKREKPPAAQDMEDPVAEAGRPINKVFGTVIIKGLNVLDYRDKNMRKRKIDA